MATCRRCKYSTALRTRPRPVAPAHAVQCRAWLLFLLNSWIDVIESKIRISCFFTFAPPLSAPSSPLSLHTTTHACLSVAHSSSSGSAHVHCLSDCSMRLCAALARSIGAASFPAAARVHRVIAPTPQVLGRSCTGLIHRAQVVFADSSLAGFCIMVAFFIPIAWQSSSLQARKTPTHRCPHRPPIGPFSLLMATLHFPMNRSYHARVPLPTHATRSPSRHTPHPHVTFSRHPHLTFSRRRRVSSHSGQFQVRYSAAEFAPSWS